MAVAQLGYLGFEVRDLDAWKSFTTQILGLQIDSHFDNGGFRLKMDEHAYRFIIQPGDSDDLSVVGWEATSANELTACLERLQQAGVEVTEAPQQTRAQREVQALYQFRDPAGVPTELYYGPTLSPVPFNSDLLLTNFVAGPQGLGHLVLTANSQEESMEFYCNLLGFKLSDYIRCEMFGYPVDIAFLHANSRHHSVAFGSKQPKRLHHFMLEVESMDDVGLCYDRALKSGIPIMQTLGRHPNDKMFSFYAKTPSGFQFEFGCGGRQIDDKTWEPSVHNCVSEWGHHPPQIFKPRKKTESRP